MGATEPDRPCLTGSKEGSMIVLSTEARDRSDLEGSVVCEKGVVGETRAEPSAAPLANVVASSGSETSFLETTGLTCSAAQTEMYRSTHFETMVSSNSPGASSLKRSPAAR